MSTPTLTPPQDTVESLAAGVDALLGTELWRLPGAAEAALIDRLESVGRRLEFAKLLVLADFDARGIAGEQKALSTAAFLRDRLRISPSDAAARIRTARELTATTAPSGETVPPVLPATAAGMADGVLSADHAQVISRAIRRLPTGLDPAARTELETALATYGRDADPAQLAVAGRRAHAMLDPDGALADDKPSRRELSFLGDLDGTDIIRGRLDAEGSAIVRTAVDALAAPGPAVDGVRDPRPPKRRRAEAIIEICRRFLDTGAVPMQGGEKPHLTITICFHDLQLRLAGHATFDTANPYRRKPPVVWPAMPPSFRWCWEVAASRWMWVGPPAPSRRPSVARLSPAISAAYTPVAISPLRGATCTIAGIGLTSDQPPYPISRCCAPSTTGTSTTPTGKSPSYKESHTSYRQH